MSDSRPTNNPKKHISPRLTYQYGVFREIGRADEYPVEADGSQTISELCREYTHIVADLRPWPYFDIPGCLKRLSWSDDECSGHITSQWFKNSQYTRHAVVQLALYTCQPFLDIPPASYPRSSATEGYIVDQRNLENGDKKQKKYLCHSVRSLVEALATALMHYESQCERMDTWRRFQTQRPKCIMFLKDFLLLLNASRRRFPPQDPRLWHNRKLQGNIKNVIPALEAFSYDDYQHAGAPTNKPGDPRAHANKFYLLSEMKKAFKTYMPTTWSDMATYRALAAIMNQIKIKNANGKEWFPGAIKRLVDRGPDPRLRFTIPLMPQKIERWYTRPE